MKKKLILCLAFCALLCGCGKKCDIPDCREKAENGAQYCALHACAYDHCQNRAEDGHSFCRDHLCPVEGCEKGKAAAEKKCQEHTETDKSAASAVDELIRHLAKTPRNNNGIKNARAKYEALTDDQKQLVTMLPELEMKEADYKEQFCTKLASAISEVGFEGYQVRGKYENGAIYIIENCTFVSYEDVFWGADYLAPTAASSSQTIKARVEKEGYSDVDVYVEIQVEGVTIVRAKNGTKIE